VIAVISTIIAFEVDFIGIAFAISTEMLVLIFLLSYNSLAIKEEWHRD
jgi:hypothetical protein